MTGENKKLLNGEERTTISGGGKIYLLVGVIVSGKLDKRRLVGTKIHCFGIPCEL